MLWSIDTCQNKVSADQYHVYSELKLDLIEVSFFLKLTADQGLVVDWIAGPSQVRHSHTPDPGLIFALFLWLDAATQPRYVSKALDSRCFSCSGTVWKIYFSCIFRWFQSRFNII